MLPILNPSPSTELQAGLLRPLTPILKQYKSLLKITTRDVSLRSQYKIAIASSLKDVERWVAEAKVAANIAAGNLGWEPNAKGSVLDSGELDVKERWALEQLGDALLEKGALVPLSKK